mgnify:CR=1 FL=1
MKKIIIGLVAVIALLALLAPKLLGFSVLHLNHAVQVSTSLSAKLACSSKFITGLNDQQIVKDLSSYSPVANLVDIEYDLDNQRVNTHLYGMAAATAQFKVGVGCSLVAKGNDSNKNLELSALPDNTLTWPAGSSADKIAPSVQDEVTNIMRSDNEKGYNTRALLVVKDGELIAEAYGPNITPATPLLGWSMAKSTTAILLAILEQQQMISRQQTQLFQEWKNDERANLTLTHLLQMSSGLGFDETYAPGSDATHMLFTAESASDVAIKSPLAHLPGKHFSYSSGTTNLLSRLISNTLGGDAQTVQNFVQAELFQPLGMTNSIFEVDTSGVMVGSSYLYSSGRDWARLGLLMLNDGVINEKRLLPSGWTEAAQAPNSSDNDKRYGYQFWLNSGERELRWPQLPKDAYAMMGNRKQSVMIIPSKNVVLVRVGWTTGEYPMAFNYSKLLDAL